jgi:hypothetical protein
VLIHVERGVTRDRVGRDNFMVWSGFGVRDRAGALFSPLPNTVADSKFPGVQ